MRLLNNRGGFIGSHKRRLSVADNLRILKNINNQGGNFSKDNYILFSRLI
jgi:hypothetical protein